MIKNTHKITITADQGTNNILQNYFSAPKWKNLKSDISFIEPHKSENDIKIEFINTGETIQISFRKPTYIGEILDFVVNAQTKERKTESFPLGSGKIDCIEGIFIKGTKRIKLTEKEIALLEFLYNKKDRSTDRKELLAAVWDYADSVETHTLETHIYRLRQKIENDPSDPQLLITKPDGTYTIAWN